MGAGEFQKFLVRLSDFLEVELLDRTVIGQKSVDLDFDVRDLGIDGLAESLFDQGSQFVEQAQVLGRECLG